MPWPGKRRDELKEQVAENAFLVSATRRDEDTMLPEINRRRTGRFCLPGAALIAKPGAKGRLEAVTQVLKGLFWAWARGGFQERVISSSLRGRTPSAGAVEG